MRPGEVPRRRSLEALPLEEVDRHAVGSDEHRDVLDRRRQRVLQRKLSRRLGDDGEERTRPLELAVRLTRGIAGPKRLRRSQREGRQTREDVLVRIVREDELEHADGRLA